MLNSLALVAAASIGSSLVAAHAGCSSNELQRRNPGGPLITAEGRSAKFGRRDDSPCSGYYYKPASDIAPSYPTTWQTAAVPDHDTDAAALLGQIKTKLSQQFPNDVAHGKPNGDWTGVTYNGGQDPDCWWTYTQCTTPKPDTGLPADITTVPEPGSYGLTFDDGPNCGNGGFYQFLKSNDFKATLFYIGSNVMNWPLQAIQGIEDGHEICAHTWSHQYMTALTTDQVFAELYYTRKIIKDLLNVTVTCWRPPFGDVDNRVRLIANELNMTTIVWSDDTDDWSEGTGTPPAKIDANYQAIIDKKTSGQFATHGPIVLAHELSQFTMNEAMKFLPLLKAAFSHLVPIATAYNNTHPYEERNIAYPDFNSFIGGHENVTTTSLAPSASAPAASASSARASGAPAVSAQSSAPAASGSASGSGGSNAGNAVGQGSQASASAKPSSAAYMRADVAFGGVLGGIAALVGLVAGL